MTVDEVRRVLGPDFDSFMKTPASKFPTDAFREYNLYVYYKTPGICEAVELFSPARPEYLEQDFINRPYSEVLKWFQTIDDDLKLSGTGFKSMKHGICIYSPFAGGSPDKPVEGVLVFEKGYWD